MYSFTFVFVVMNVVVSSSSKMWMVWILHLHMLKGPYHHQQSGYKILSSILILKIGLQPVV